MPKKIGRHNHRQTSRLGRHLSRGQSLDAGINAEKSFYSIFYPLNEIENSVQRNKLFVFISKESNSSVTKQFKITSR